MKSLSKRVRILLVTLTAIVIAACAAGLSACSDSKEDGTAAPAMSVGLNILETTLAPEDTTTLEATVTMGSGETYDGEYTWEQSNDNVTILADGATCIVRAENIGESKVTVACGNFSAFCKITIAEKPKEITFDKTSLNLTEGESDSLTVTVEMTHGAEAVDFGYAVSVSGVVEISKEGGTLTVTALREGTTVITVTAGDIEATCTVTVTADIHEHTLTKVEATEAGCTTPGNIEYWHCAGCGKYFSDEKGENEISEADTVTPAAHTYAGQGTTESSYISWTWGAADGEPYATLTLICVICGSTWTSDPVTAETTGNENEYAVTLTGPDGKDYTATETMVPDTYTVKIDEIAGDVETGSTVCLTATVTKNGTETVEDAALTWTITSGSGFAEIKSETGVLTTGRAAGSVTVKVTFAPDLGEAVSDTLTIDVRLAFSESFFAVSAEQNAELSAESLSVDAAVSVLYLTDAYVSGTYEGYEIYISSGNEGIASVAKEIKDGKLIISAAAVSGSTVVTVAVVNTASPAEAIVSATINVTVTGVGPDDTEEWASTKITFGTTNKVGITSEFDLLSSANSVNVQVETSGDETFVSSVSVTANGSNNIAIVAAQTDYEMKDPEDGSASDYTHRLRLMSSGAADYRSVRIVTEGPATIRFVVYAQTTAYTGIEAVGFYRDTVSDAGLLYTCDGVRGFGEPVVWTVYADRAGTYYFASSTGDVCLYEIDILATKAGGDDAQDSVSLLVDFTDYSTYNWFISLIVSGVEYPVDDLSSVSQSILGSGITSTDPTGLLSFVSQTGSSNRSQLKKSGSSYYFEGQKASESSGANLFTIDVSGYAGKTITIEVSWNTNSDSSTTLRLSTDAAGSSVLDSATSSTSTKTTSTFTATVPEGCDTLYLNWTDRLYIYSIYIVIA